MGKGAGKGGNKSDSEAGSMLRALSASSKLTAATDTFMGRLLAWSKENGAAHDTLSLVKMSRAYEGREEQVRRRRPPTGAPAAAATAAAAAADPAALPAVLGRPQQVRADGAQAGGGRRHRGHPRGHRQAGAAGRGAQLPAAERGEEEGRRGAAAAGCRVPVHARGADGPAEHQRHAAVRGMVAR